MLTNPNSRHGVIFLINLASDVPPVVEKTGLILVTFLIIFLALKIVLFGLVKNASPFAMNSSLNLHLFFLQVAETIRLIFFLKN